MAEIVFWMSLAFLAYIYLGYPAIVWLWARFSPRAVDKKEFYPSLSVVMAAHNEEANIASRVKNILACDYPAALLELVVVSDGSSDRTVESIKPFLGPGVKLIELNRRRGKASSLNSALSASGGDIVVFADARQTFGPEALKELAANFHDKEIGAVSGELVFRNDEKTVTGEGVDFYWRYEKFIRKAESAVNSTIGATGAIYAIRRSLFRPIASDTLLDDVVIPMNVVSRGYRCVFEPKALAYDRVANDPADEARRKIRTIAGNFQMFFSFSGFLNPLKNRLWFQTFSHKFLRVVSPAFIASLFVSNLFLSANPVFRVCLAGQAAFYLLAFFGHCSRKKRKTFKPFSIPYAFMMLNILTVKAFFAYISSDPHAIWRQGARPEREGHA